MTKRTTIYLDPKLHQALRVKALQMSVSLSELVSDAVRHSLKEDQIDLQAAQDRAAESETPYEIVLKKLKKDGLV